MDGAVALLILFGAILVFSFVIGWVLSWTESTPAPRRRGSFWHAWSRR